MAKLRYIAKLLQSVERIESDSLKLLGATIDCELSFNKHQSRTQSPRAFWPAGERPDRLWDNRFELYF